LSISLISELRLYVERLEPNYGSECLQPELYMKFVKTGLERMWHTKLAKVRGGSVSLLAHSLNVMSFTETILKVMKKDDETSCRIAIAASFFHDFGKETDEFQRVIVEGGVEPHKHIPEKVVIPMLRQIGFNVEDAKEALGIARAMESIEDTEHLADILGHPPKRTDLVEVVRLADLFAALRSVDEVSRLGTTTKRLLDKLGLTVRYHKFSVVRGMLTQLAHRAMHKLYSRKNFYPLIYFPNGTVYIGRGNLDIQFDEVTEALKEEFDCLFGAELADKLGRTAFGTIAGTHIKSPDFLYISDKTVEEFWNYVRSRRFISKPTVTKDKIKVYKQHHPELDLSLAEDCVREIDALFYILVLLNDIANHAAEGVPEAKAKFKGLLKEILKVGEKFADQLRGISHTTPFEKRLDIIESLIKQAGFEDMKRLEKVDALINTAVNISKVLSKSARKKHNPKTEKLADLIIGEMQSPLMNAPREQTSRIWENYKKGKHRGSPVCVLCGGSPYETATASLIGSGTESFSNFLMAGTSIGGENKIRLCLLCSYEARIRSLLLPNAAEVIYVFPQVAGGEETWNRWQQSADALINDMESNGISPLTQWSQWAEKIESNRINEPVSTILAEITLSQQKRHIRNVERILKEEYSSVEEVPEIWGTPNVEVKRFIDLAEKVVREEIEPNPEFKEVMRRKLGEMSRARIIYRCPNYLLILSSIPIRRGRGTQQESETASFLRKTFVGAILARLFLGAVVFPQFPLELLYDFHTYGYVKVPMKIGLRETYRKLNIDEWIRIPQIDAVLLQLASLFLLERTFQGAGAGYGKDTLLHLAKRQPGESLNRLLQSGTRMKAETAMHLIKRLNNWEGLKEPFHALPEDYNLVEEKRGD